MDTIPIEFTHNDILYKGHFLKIAGAGSTALFHLMINGKMYRGQLFCRQEKWGFSSNDNMFEELGEFFGQYIVAWYE